MGAAPLIIDDPVFSPELALVDAELSASLRAGLPDLHEDVAASPRAPVAGLVLEQNRDTDDAHDDLGAPEVVEVPPEPAPLPVDDDLPDYVIAPGAEPIGARDVGVASSSPVAEVAPLGEPSEGDVIDRVEDYALDSGTMSGPLGGSFPTLPSLELRQEALDETDAALRKIRDQLGSGGTARGRPRIRRRFIVFSGLSAVAALAALAADSYSNGSVALPSGWLGF